MNEIFIRDEFIKLGQALKLSGIAESGVDAKDMILEGLICVNGNVEYQRGKKLYVGDTFSFENNEIKVSKK